MERTIAEEKKYERDFVGRSKEGEEKSQFCKGVREEKQEYNYKK